VKRRDPAEVLQEAYRMADEHLAATAAVRDAATARDVLAVDVMLPLIAVRDRLDRQIRKLRRRVRGLEGQTAALARSRGLALEESRFVTLQGDAWAQVHQMLNRVPGLEGIPGAGREGDQDG
jgi:hypothetical protein